MNRLEEIETSIWEHVAALRFSLLQILLTVFVGFVFSFLWYGHLFQLLTHPLQKAFQSEINGSLLEQQSIGLTRIFNHGPKPISYLLKKGQEPFYPLPEGIHSKEEGVFFIPNQQYLDIREKREHPLVLLYPTEGFVLSCWVSLWAGVLVTSPLWMVFLGRFIMPGLYTHEKKWVIPFIFLSYFFLTGGFLFAYYTIIPLTTRYLLIFNSGMGINGWSLSGYINYLGLLLFATGLLFELFASLLFMVHLNFFTTEFLSSKRRQAYLIAFILGALLTPPDVLSQVMVAIPCIVFYELSVLYSRLKFKPEIFN